MKRCFGFLAFFVSLLPFLSCQERRFTSSELSQIPDNIIQCYTNRQLWDRFNRLPYSVDSLIAIVRKIELNPAVSLALKTIKL